MTAHVTMDLDPGFQFADVVKCLDVLARVDHVVAYYRPVVDRITVAVVWSGV